MQTVRNDPATAAIGLSDGIQCPPRQLNLISDCISQCSKIYRAARHGADTAEKRRAGDIAVNAAAGQFVGRESARLSDMERRPKNATFNPTTASYIVISVPGPCAFSNWISAPLAHYPPGARLPVNPGLSNGAKRTQDVFPRDRREAATSSNCPANDVHDAVETRPDSAAATDSGTVVRLRTKPPAYTLVGAWNAQFARDRRHDRWTAHDRAAIIAVETCANGLKNHCDSGFGWRFGGHLFVRLSGGRTPRLRARCTAS